MDPDCQTNGRPPVANGRPSPAQPRTAVATQSTTVDRRSTVTVICQPDTMKIKVDRRAKRSTVPSPVA
ncbi:unnamed protein product [Cuscuta campestris]|uniref:Uncharacterized protein n=1 Tax=Cuscuta campestris TaxID=132261 RepID=A0A484L6B8_9ASTE|nr:unnamed protein product [Cuscuta campestris]